LIELLRPIDEAAWPLQSLIKAKGLSLKIDLPQDLPQVLVDFDQARMIMHQLLDNARRYTSEGGIVVRATALPEHVLVEVEDTGRGISPDMHEQIFLRFIRGDGASEGINSSERGIGLGLAICKQLVERQGGTIWMKSTPGQGSTFCFTLRYANATPSPEKSKATLAAAA
jgi:signal transduction histidine kinase